MSVSRREFLESAAALAALAAVPAAVGADATKKIGLAAQMYSVRGIVKDQHGFFAMLRLMKDFGYTGAEICGLWASPEQTKSYMDSIGLKCAGSHTGLGSCLPNAMEKTCAYNLAFGNNLLVMPWAQPPKDCTDLKGWWKKLGADLSAGAEIAKKCGCTLAYHNHGHEFTQKIDGVCIWDLIMADASDALKFQFDVGHLAHAGESAAKWFGRYPNRVVSIHAKDICVPNAPLTPAPGTRGIDWPEMFALTQANAVRWYVVEAEKDPCDTQKMKYGCDFLRKHAPFLY